MRYKRQTQTNRNTHTHSREYTYILHIRGIYVYVKYYKRNDYDSPLLRMNTSCIKLSKWSFKSISTDATGRPEGKNITLKRCHLRFRHFLPIFFVFSYIRCFLVRVLFFLNRSSSKKDTHLVLYFTFWYKYICNRAERGKRACFCSLKKCISKRRAFPCFFSSRFRGFYLYIFYRSHSTQPHFLRHRCARHLFVLLT